MFVITIDKIDNEGYERSRCCKQSYINILKPLVLIIAYIKDSDSCLVCIFVARINETNGTRSCRFGNARGAS